MPFRRTQTEGKDVPRHYSCAKLVNYGFPITARRHAAPRLSPQDFKEKWTLATPAKAGPGTIYCAYPKYARAHNDAASFAVARPAKLRHASNVVTITHPTRSQGKNNTTAGESLSEGHAHFQHANLS
jgi:hypothetical protein